ncbi:hypothetical protein JEM67_09840 [Serratia sp. PAMC26656]|uniref:hypothetical protein n=1 Tax=Serratia sp. PAMC26656 TaxID=2775909 RepID=UPI0018F329C1|nr:hypothetical protein [Serratia sp. PAMC26656]MBJ7889558.1 hypothetical protein [Serratia sp. PAMC26656]
METNWEDERAAFMAGEIGEAVMQLVIDGAEISQGNIVDYLELKRKTVGNTIHKGVLRDAAALVRRGGR